MKGNQQFSKDITELFKQLVTNNKLVLKQTELSVDSHSSSSHNNSKKSSNHDILKPVKNQSAFMASCYKVSKILSNLDDFLSKTRLAYLQGSNAPTLSSSSTGTSSPSMTESERNKIDAEATACLKQCQANIDQLLATLQNQSSQSHHSQSQVLDHHSRVVSYLVEQYDSVSKAYHQQQSDRLAKSLEERQGYLSRHTPLIMDRHRSLGSPLTKTSLHHHSNNKSDGTIQTHEQADSDQLNLATGEIDSAFIEGLDMQTQEQLRRENLSLQSSLANLTDEIRTVEQQVLAISQAQQLISHNLMQQRDDLDHIHKQTQDSHVHITKGNTELEKAAQSGSKFRIFVLLIILALSFTLLLLHFFEG